MLEFSNKMEKQIDRTKLEDLLKQKFFYDMSFSIYGGKIITVLLPSNYTVFRYRLYMAVKISEQI